MHTTVAQADTFVGSQVFWVLLAVIVVLAFATWRALGAASRSDQRSRDAEAQGARMAAQAQAQQPAKRRGGGGNLPPPPTGGPDSGTGSGDGNGRIAV